MNSSVVYLNNITPGNTSTNSNTLNCTQPRIKIITIGSPGVGKSCLIKQYCENRFEPKYLPTIGIDYGVRSTSVSPPAHMSSTAANLVVRVNFWDMAGGDEYSEIRNEFYIAAEGVVLVYDVADVASFKALDKWVDEMEKYINVRRVGGSNSNCPDFVRLEAKPPVVVVCANKVANNDSNKNSDGGKKRVVTEAEGRQWAKRHMYNYFETSASSGMNVKTMFESLFKDVVAAFM